MISYLQIGSTARVSWCWWLHVHPTRQTSQNYEPSDEHLNLIASRLDSKDSSNQDLAPYV